MTFVRTERELNYVLSVVETGLNYAGYIPFVSKLSGSLRISYGQLEVIAAVATAALLAARAFTNTDLRVRAQGLDRAREVFSCYALHGVANVGRGILETFSFVGLAACLPYDLLQNRFRYPYEELEELRPIRHGRAEAV